MPHRDALVVEAQHDEAVAGLGLDQPVSIERIEVLRCADRQLLDLTLGTWAPVRDNPRRANLYQFTLSNPLRYIDPDGRNPANTSDYRSEAEVRASYAAALEGDSNWMVSGPDYFSGTGGRYVKLKRNDGRMHECGAQGCFDNEGVDDELTEMWIADDLPRMAGQYGTLARTGAVVDKRFKGSMQAAAARAAGAAIGVTLVFGGVYAVRLFAPRAIGFGDGSLGAAEQKIIQSGGNSISAGTAKILNDVFETSLHRREWGRAREALKADVGLSPNFHGLITSTGLYLDKQKNVLGNLLDYVRGGL